MAVADEYKIYRLEDKMSNIQECNNMKKNLIKVLIWVPVILMSLFIFGFSNQEGDKSGNLSQKTAVMVVKIAGNMNFIDVNEDNVNELAERIEYPIRKLAHVTEYMVFGLLILLALYIWAFKARQLYLTAFFTSFVFACTDEIHQLFVAGRSGRFTDVCIDSAGVFIGLLMVFLISRAKPHLIRNKSLIEID